MGDRSVGALFSFHGRCGRLAYLGIFVVQMVVLSIGVFVGVLGVGASVLGGSGGGAIISLLFVLAVLGATVWVGAAAMVRRARDMGWSPKIIVPLWYGVALVGTMMPPLLPIVWLFQTVVGFVFIFKGPVPFDPAEDAAAYARRAASAPSEATTTGMEAALAAMIAKRRSVEREAPLEPAPSMRVVSAASVAGRADRLAMSPAQRGGFGRRGFAT